MMQSERAYLGWCWTHSSLWNNHRRLCVIQTHRRLFPGVHSQHGRRIKATSGKICLPRKGGTAQLPQWRPSGTPQMKQLICFCLQAMWDWLYDDQDIYPLNMPTIQVTANAVVKGPPSLGHPFNLMLQNQKTIWEALWNLLSQLLLPGLSDANRNRRLINKRMGRGWGESLGTLTCNVEIFKRKK